MNKPKNVQHPVSDHVLINMPRDLKAEVEAMAAKNLAPRNSEINRLIRRGLEAEARQERAAG